MKSSPSSAIVEDRARCHGKIAINTVVTFHVTGAPSVAGRFSHSKARPSVTAPCLGIFPCPKVSPNKLSRQFPYRDAGALRVPGKQKSPSPPLATT